jgi:hypothetical protein
MAMLLGFDDSLIRMKPKNLTPWWDSNPGSSVLEAGRDATPPGQKVISFEACSDQMSL